MNLATPVNEAQRLAAVRRYDVLDTPPDGSFDRITALAATLFNVPIALVTVVDEDRIWFKSRHGLDGVSEINRDPGLCASVICQDAVYVVERADTDLRTLSNPLVAGEFGLRFYAAAPLKTHDGFNLGTMCIIDREPRTLSSERTSMLTALAEIVVDELELRLSARRAIASERWNHSDLARYKLLLERARDIIFICRRSDGRIVEANAAALQAYGYVREEMLALTIFDIRAPDTHATLRSLLEQPTQDDLHFETLHRRKDGTTFPVEVTVQGATIGGEELLLGITRDISERKHAQEVMKALLQQTAEVSRLKSEFVATMSHELRTPMNAVLGMTELLLDSPLAPQQREYVSLVRSSGESLLRVVDDMIDFSTLDAGELTSKTEDFSLDEELRRVATEFASKAAEKRLALAVQHDSAIPDALHGDWYRVRQVLAQLLDNAVKFTDTGSVTLHTTLRGDDGASIAVAFTIRDTGIGIDPAQREAIFEPFRQADGSAKRARGGAGVGLPLAKRVIEFLGGALEVTSELGAGSAFSFVLRFTPVAKVKAEERPSRAASARTERILLVDDNPINLRLGCAQLERLGFPCETVDNGADAVEAALGGQFAAILMDCQMPRMSGFDATRAIRGRETARHVPIIAMTANALASDRAACLAAGMDDYLAKPVRLEELRAVLHRWANPPPAFDRDWILEQVGDDAEAAGMLLESALEGIPPLVERLARTLPTGDVEKSRELVHELKGVAGNVGAGELLALAGRLHEQLREGRELDPRASTLLREASKRFEEAARETMPAR